MKTFLAETTVEKTVTDQNYMLFKTKFKRCSINNIVKIEKINFCRGSQLRNFSNEKSLTYSKLGFCEMFSERSRIRTYDRLLRRQVLYPAELCTHF